MIVTVLVKQGWLRGVILQSTIGGTYISFKGIPFATPPVGNLRFKDPQPAISWTGIRDAVEHGSKCAQFNVYTRKMTGDDDCLFLNVSTTSLTGSRPVMVWIHGGAFLSGSGDADMHAPDYLMEAGIVFVSINYRLGVLGFLQLDHEASTGNMGLKDQVAALKWVKENIAQFGGDPNNVTLFGVSAGSMSIHYLLASPLAKGLFHKAIMQSGTATSISAHVVESLEVARRLVSLLGKDINDPADIVEYLRTVPALEIVEAQQKMICAMVGISFVLVTPTAVLTDKKLELTLLFGPTLDDKSTEPFLPKPFEDLITDSLDIPVIIGYNSHEGAAFLSIHDKVYTELDQNFVEFLPTHLAAIASPKKQEMADLLRKCYFGDGRITEDSLENYVLYYGDISFVIGIHETVDIQRTKKSPTYFYKLCYDDPSSIAKTAFPVKVAGAIHTEELQYLFFQSSFRKHIKMDPGSTKRLLRDRYIRMWTNFAKYGNPTPTLDDLITEKWTPVTRTSKNYLEIDADLRMGVDPDGHRIETWKRVRAMVQEQ